MNKNDKTSQRKYSAKHIAIKVCIYVILCIFAFWFIIPFIFALATSFTTPNGIYDVPFKWFPSPFTMENYVELFQRVNIAKGFLNTILYITPPIVIGVLASAMAGYAFAKLNFPGKNIIFSLMISTMVIPGVITLIPAYIMFANVYRLAGTPWPLIIPGMFGAVMTMFFLKQFFATLPRDLEEAALIDGLSRGGIFLRIILPLSKAALITQLILSFNGAYNDYLGPLLYIGAKPELHTLQLMLSNLQTRFTQPYTLMMAGAIIALIPTLILFIFAQKYFVEGIVMSGIKG